MLPAIVKTCAFYVAGNKETQVQGINREGFAAQPQTLPACKNMRIFRC
jgi:hypothetical protein